MLKDILNQGRRHWLRQLNQGQRRWCSAVGAAESVKMTDFYKDIVASSGAYKYYVNGEWKESTSGKTVPILNPSTNQAAYKVQGETYCVVRAPMDPHR